MKKITKQTKMIADAHIEAKRSGKFDDPHVTSRSEVINEMINGKTFSEVLRQVELRFVTITSIIMSDNFSHNTKAYKDGVYKGFKSLLQ